MRCGFHKPWGIFDKVSDYWFLKKDSVPLRQFGCLFLGVFNDTVLNEQVVWRQMIYGRMVINGDLIQTTWRGRKYMKKVVTESNSTEIRGRDIQTTKQN
jgi:hypothetical protein